MRCFVPPEQLVLILLQPHLKVIALGFSVKYSKQPVCPKGSLTLWKKRTFTVKVFPFLNYICRKEWQRSNSCASVTLLDVPSQLRCKMKHW